jgi:hypothetical protein
LGFSEVVLIDFILYDGSPLDVKLMAMWEDDHYSDRLNYEIFVGSLDPHIVNAKADENYASITLTFENEKYLTWFILKWS